MTVVSNSAFDELLLVRVNGMHCHRCEDVIRRALLRQAGVHEVEVDFPSGQASILFNPELCTAQRLVELIASSGYEIIGFTELHSPSSLTVATAH